MITDSQAMGILVMSMAGVAFLVNHLRQGLHGICHDIYVWRLTRKARKAALLARRDRVQ